MLLGSRLDRTWPASKPADVDRLVCGHDRGPGVAGSGANNRPTRHLLQAVSKPANAASHCKESKRGIRGQPQAGRQRGKRDIDRGAKPCRRAHLRHHLLDTGWWIEGREKRCRSRIPLRIKRVPEPGNGQPGCQVAGNRLLGARSLYFLQQRPHEHGRVAMERARQRCKAYRTQAPNDAPVDAVTRAANAEAVSSWSARSTSARRINGRCAILLPGQSLNDVQGAHRRSSRPQRHPQGDRPGFRLRPGAQWRHGRTWGYHPLRLQPEPHRPASGLVRRSRFLSARSKNWWRRCVPQQARRLLERRCCRQLNRIPAAVVEPALNDGGDGCGDDRLAEGHCARGNGVRPSATLAALDQGCDVVTPIQAAARIGRIGLHANLTAAHIRIESLGAHPQRLKRLTPRQPLRHS